MQLGVVNRDLASQKGVASHAGLDHHYRAGASLLPASQWWFDRPIELISA